MAGLFDNQAEIYLDARPNYPSDWYSKLSDLTLHHSLAWDVGTGNGQAAVSVAEHYERVIGTDISKAQLKYTIPHPRVQYKHTPSSMSENELVALIGGDNSVDLVTVAEAVHWFDLQKFYSIVTRVLKKPGGIIAVWGYNKLQVNPEFDRVKKELHDATMAFWNPKVSYLFEGYKTLAFPFESVGLGFEGEPMALEIPKKLSFEGFLRVVKSSSAFASAMEQGVDLLSENLVKKLENAWGGQDLIRSVTYKAFMLAGKVKI
ncbi:hypothetical protein Pint_27398 [Pistacia integerrima]|uniref:Uncharacterized protein n=1 Tax=Pistacia integerrima TaxID=434235 RepID=A0ACC0YRT1_9ROSI|nr:hypothetical protein Pint_27398 [Pistacia integerrima]